MLKYANRCRTKIIGVASKKDSLLLKASDIKLLLPKVKESDDTGMVPTSSTSITLLLGDCLANTIISAKDFQKKIQNFSSRRKYWRFIVISKRYYGYRKKITFNWLQKEIIRSS